MITTRRKFLKTASAIAVAPFILPSNIWAAETKPSNTLGMGFVGMGKQHRGLLDNFLRQDVKILGVCDVDTTRRTNAKNKVNDYYTKNPDKGKPECKDYIDFQELMARKDIDLVCIATPCLLYTSPSPRDS